MKCPDCGSTSGCDHGQWLWDDAAIKAVSDDLLRLVQQVLEQDYAGASAFANHVVDDLANLIRAIGAIGRFTKEPM